MMLRLRPAPRLPPDSPFKATAQRALMGAARLRLAHSQAPAAKPAARALGAAARGRPSAAERHWLERIDQRRAEIAGYAHVRKPEDLGVFDVAMAVRWMSIPPALGFFLMRLVAELGPRSCLEVGTGLGISGAYQAAALELRGEGRLVSVDIAPGPAALAREGFESLGLAARAQVLVGEPGDVLEAGLRVAAPVDLALVDADHRLDATIADLETIAPRLAPGAVVVFDDVGLSWSGMRDAWRLVGEHERVAETVYLGRLGLALIAA